MFALRDCTQQEIDEINRLKAGYYSIPDDVVIIDPLKEGNKETIYRRQTKDLDSTHEERIEYIMLMQTEHMSAIRKMLLFFVILTCIGIAAGLIAVIAAAA
ncbi:MAG: hypothetical protein ACI3VQ_06765 [Faecousia sp.]